MSVGIIKLIEISTASNNLPFTDIASILLILFVVLLIIQKEFFRIASSSASKRWQRMVDTFIIPGLFAVGFIILARVIAIIN